MKYCKDTLKFPSENLFQILILFYEIKEMLTPLQLCVLTGKKNNRDKITMIGIP